MLVPSHRMTTNIHWSSGSKVSAVVVTLLLASPRLRRFMARVELPLIQTWPQVPEARTALYSPGIPAAPWS